MWFINGYLVLFQEVCGLTTVACPEGKKCKSKCRDTIKFNLGDQASNVCENFKRATLMEQGRKRYKLELQKWLCSSGHDAMGSSEAGKMLLPALYVVRLLIRGSVRTLPTGFMS